MYLYKFFEQYAIMQQQGKAVATIRKEIRELLGVSRMTLSKYEKTRRAVLSVAEINAICTYFSCSAQDFVDAQILEEFYETLKPQIKSNSI